MCGLTGIAGFIDSTDIDAFKDLLWIDAVRGMDNTGAASVLYENPDGYNLCKVTGGVHELLDRKALDKVTQSGVSFLMGHNRSKTLGTLAAKNAHPFVFNNVIGAHNGTLTWSSKGRMKDDTKFETDSEAMYCDINEFGIEETIKKMDGAWALTWYDRVTKQINFLRNKERPLFYVLDDSNSTIYWASEAGMLYLALNRNNITFRGKVKPVPENTWVRWQLNEKPAFQLEKPVHRHLAAPTFSVYTNNSYSNAYQQNQRQQNIMGRVDKIFNKNKQNIMGPVTKIETPPILLNDNSSNRVKKDKWELNRYIQPSHDNPGFYKTWDDGYLFQDKFEKLMTDGCTVCAQSPVWTEPVKFLKDGSFICGACMFDTDNIKTVFDLVDKMS